MSQQLQALPVAHTGLFPVYRNKKNNELVSLRDVHQALGVKKDFNHWYKAKMKEFGFTTSDYAVYALEGVNPKGGRTRQDVAISLRNAKKIALSVQTPAGDKVKEYFLTCEQIALTVVTPTPTPKPQVKLLPIGSYTQRPVQLQISKQVNKFNYSSGGKFKLIEYNRVNCVYWTGFRPNIIVKTAKLQGLPSKQRTSAKQVLRYTQPKIAAQMSICDDLVQRGIAYSDATQVAHAAAPFYDTALALGIGFEV